MKAWLKGGLIALGIYVVVLLIAFLIPITDNFIPNWGIVILYLPFTSLIYWLISPITSDLSSSTFTLIFIGNLLLIFLVGSIIGWVVGKIRNRNVVSKI